VSEIPPLYLKFEADIHGIKSSIEAIQKELQKFDKTAQHTGKEVQEMSAKTVASGVVMGNVLASLAHKALDFGKETVGAFDEVGGEIKKMRRVLGGTPEEMSHLRFAAEEMGISSQRLTTGVKILSKHLVDNDKAAQALGISYRDASGKILPAEELMGRLGDKFKEMPNGMDKTALAVKLFGRSGIEMIPMLNLGKKGLEEMAAEADKLGLTMSGKDLQTVTDYTMKQRQLHATIQGLQVAFGRNLVPVMTAVTATIQKAITGVADFIKHNQTLMKIVGGLTLVIGALIVAQKLNVYWTKLQTAWAGRATAETGIFAAAQTIATAATTAWSVAMGILSGEVAFLEAPIWAIIAVIIGLVEVFFYAIRHSKTFADFLIKAIGLVGKAYGTVIKYILNGIAFLVKAWGMGAEKILTTLSSLAKPFEKFGIHLGSNLESAAKLVENGTQTISDKLASWAEKAPDVGQQIGTKIGKGIEAAANFDAMAWIKKQIGNLAGPSFTAGDASGTAGVPALKADVKPGSGKGKKASDQVKEYIKELNAAISANDAQFTAAKAKMAGLAFGEQAKIVKAFMAKNAVLLEAAKKEEFKTRGTTNHTAAVNALNKAVKEQAKIQTYMNSINDKAAKSASDAERQQSALNNTMISSQSWLAAHASDTLTSNTGSVTVPVSIDGREVFRAVQTQATRNSRRNVSNGLTFTGAVL